MIRNPLRHRGFVFAFLALISGAAFLASPDEHKTMEYEGEIQNYKPGNLLTVRKRPRVEVKYDLSKKDTVYSIDPGVHKGSKVDVVERDLDDGKHEIAVKLKDNH